MSGLGFVDNPSSPTLISNLTSEYNLSYYYDEYDDTSAISQIEAKWNENETHGLGMSISEFKYVPHHVLVSDGNTSSNGDLLNKSAYISVPVIALCGVPIFCSNEASFFCSNVTLNQCEECSMTGAGIFAAACVVLGLLIVVGNVMVITIMMNKDVKDGFSKLKASLAFADAFTGNDFYRTAR